MSYLRQTIWIATDHRASTVELEAALRQRHDVIVLPDGNAASEWLKTAAPPALVILDRADACATIRKLDATLQLLVLVTDGSTAALNAGASDVLRVPFEAEELAVRITNLLAQKRSHNWDALLQQAPVAICMFERPGILFTFANAAYLELVGGRDVVGKQLLEALPEIANHGLEQLLEHVFATGQTYYGKEVAFALAHHGPGESSILNFTYTARRTVSGAIDGVIATVVDVTEQVVARRHAEALAAELGKSERALADERDKLAGIFEVSPAAMAMWTGHALVFDKVNPEYQAIFA
ncbi:MAG TPA: PAS domain-containing protein [Kofleriaceae bacterium]